MRSSFLFIVRLYHVETLRVSHEPMRTSREPMNSVYISNSYVIDILSL